MSSLASLGTKRCGYRHNVDPIREQIDIIGHPDVCRRAHVSHWQ